MSVWKTFRFSLWALWQHRVTRMAPEQVAKLQQSRLRRLLRHAYAKSPFYREKWAGLDLDRCDLTDLPTTSKSELMARFDDVVTDQRVRREDVERFIEDPENASRLYLDRYAVCHTSGSQGQRMLILQDPLELDLVFAFQMTRGNTRFKLGPLEAVRRLLNPGRIATIATFIRGFYPSACAWEHMPAAVRPYVRVLRLAASAPDLIEQLNRFRPTALTAYTSVLEALAIHAGRLHLAPELQQVVSTSETLSERSRQRFEALFGVRVLDNYALGECFFLSNGCPTDSGVHINADWAILEVVDGDNRPVPPGKLGDKVLLTNLAGSAQPLIRYEVGDRVVLAEGPCRCGNRLPRLERIEGRTVDFFWVQVGTEYRQLLGLVFKNALEFAPEVREWQSVQEERNRILLRLEMLPGATLDRERILRLLESQLAPLGFNGELSLDVEAVSSLSPDPLTGKIRRTISRVGAPADLMRAADAQPVAGQG